MDKMLHFVHKTDSWLVLGFSKLEPTKCPNVKNAILPAYMTENEDVSQ